MLAVLFEMDGRLWGADALLIETVIPAVRLRPVQGAPGLDRRSFQLQGHGRSGRGPFRHRLFPPFGARFQHPLHARKNVRPEAARALWRS